MVGQVSFDRVSFRRVQVVTPVPQQPQVHSQLVGDLCPALPCPQDRIHQMVERDQSACGEQFRFVLVQVVKRVVAGVAEVQVREGVGERGSLSRPSLRTVDEDHLPSPAQHFGDAAEGAVPDHPVGVAFGCVSAGVVGQRSVAAWSICHWMNLSDSARMRCHSSLLMPSGLRNCKSSS